MKTETSGAEPSRGAPDAALEALHQWEADTEALASAREENAFIDGFQAGRAGHVVLLEALRELKDASNSLTGTIRNERKNEQYLRLAKAVERAEAAIQQTERT